jgi:hypothetical protein
MTIYPDASFLVSWLYKPDPLNAKARVWFAQHQADDFLISDWSRFETINTLRDLCLRPHPPRRELIEALRRYFSHLLQVGPFEFSPVDWDEGASPALPQRLIRKNKIERDREYN